MRSIHPSIAYTFVTLFSVPRIHTIYYRPAQDTEPHSSAKKGEGSSSSGKKGKGGKWHSKRKAPDELWNEGNPPDRVNPLINFLADKLPREYLQVYVSPKRIKISHTTSN